MSRKSSVNTIVRARCVLFVDKRQCKRKAGYISWSEQYSKNTHLFSPNLKMGLND